MATTQKFIKGTGELLPRLRDFLLYRNIPHWGFTINHQMTGYMNDRAVFLAKKEIWREQVSTQKYIVQRSIERQKWIIFFIPKVGLLKFDPKTFWENSWQNQKTKRKYFLKFFKMSIVYKSQELYEEIIKNYSFVDKKKLKTATENELMALSHQTQDHIFTQYGIARKWDEAEKKKRRSLFLQGKYGR